MKINPAAKCLVSDRGFADSRASAAGRTNGVAVFERTGGVVPAGQVGDFQTP